MRSSTRRYKGKLSVEQIAEGIALALQNARDLADDARVLRDRGSYARALALSSSALEEIGKIHVLKAMVRIPPENQRLWTEQWKNFRSHERKTAHGGVDLLPDETRTSVNATLSAAVELIDGVGHSETARQRAIYVDFTDEGWISPKGTASVEAMSALRATQEALERLEELETLGLLSLDAIRIEHRVLSPIYRERKPESELTPDHVGKLRSVIPGKMREYYRALVEAGILDVDADVSVMGVPLRRFIGDSN